MISNNNILIELIKYQIKDIPPNKKLSYSDLKRISKYLNSSIFSEKKDIFENLNNINLDELEKLNNDNISDVDSETKSSKHDIGSPDTSSFLLDFGNNLSKNSNDCALWNGYITSIKNDSNDKNFYINFYYNGKKYALHRLLYINFIGLLDDNEYIKFRCINKGKCCNINHFYKIRPESPLLKPIDNIPKKKILDNIIVNFNVNFNL